MADISIPGVNSKYGTNDTIAKLMEAERIPLTREEQNLESLKDQQNTWRGVNRVMSQLRESCRTLYSFDNPFNNKLAESSDEASITASPARNATIESFNISVENIATADRFLSKEIDKDFEVPAGTYSFTVNEKTISFKWKGGKVADFVTSLNRRGGETVKASLIGVSSSSKALLIESLKTGKENTLTFSDAALDLALDTEMLQRSKGSETSFGTKLNDYSKTDGLSFKQVKIQDNMVTVPAKSGFTLDLPSKAKDNSDITFTVTLENPQTATAETDETINGTADSANEPVMPDTGMIQYRGIIVYNDSSEYQIAKTTPEPVELPPSIQIDEDNSVVFLKTKDGLIALDPISSDNAEQTYSINTEKYPGAESIVIKNNNSMKTVYFTSPTVLERTSGTSGYEPVHPITVADDARVKYEGITMTRSTNKIDDIVPDVTLNLYQPTERQAKITIKPDTEASKEALIKLVANYNDVMTEINILTQNKQEIIDEVEYFTDDEREAAAKHLGMFMADQTLNSSKNALQRIMSGTYRKEGSDISMLSQIGISTNASTGSTAYSAARLRGYLEIDEKKLDEMLESNIDDIRDLMGFDSDGDLIIDTGIAYMMQQNLQAYVQTGGIIPNRISGLDTKIKASETKIDKLEDQLAAKELQYKRQFGSMESTLNNLESQSDTITNFTNQNNRSN
ncbi:MAG: flagellar filament capping protein FliD [Treponemataceae bacterium]|nr:flagellar filament capping protein FliD [Treponemataceae bacterium]